MAILLVGAITTPFWLTACNHRSTASSDAKTASAGSIEVLDAAGDALEAMTPAAQAPGDAALSPDLASRASCSTAKPRAHGDASEVLRSGGIGRMYLLHVPPSYDGTRRTPLVLNLHGFGSNGSQQARYSGFAAKADREGFIVVSPDGTGAPLHWTYPGLGAVDDVTFIRDLLDRLEADLCVDASRVFVAGISNGAAFAQIVACRMPDRVTAVAAVAALVYPQRCGTDAPVAVIGFHGTEDPCVPFAGGTSACGQKLPVPAIEESAKNWARHDACDIAPAEQQFTPHVRTVAYSGCKGDTAVVLFVIDGGGHTWPGAADVPRLGATTHEVSATDQIWEFFTAQGNLRR